mmetsp:Transcript_30052/g.56777  ORF Transcript_30052/g.56777 Transcript_30052/m.56777 type:complete len:129 (-) Transcript_30052:1341-1727(-)
MNFKWASQTRYPLHNPEDLPTRNCYYAWPVMTSTAYSFTTSNNCPKSCTDISVWIAPTVSLYRWPQIYQTIKEALQWKEKRVKKLNCIILFTGKIKETRNSWEEPCHVESQDICNGSMIMNENKRALR